MKSNPFSLFAVLFATFSVISTASAADLTWIDANANNTWNLTELNWNPGPVAWTDSNNAIFAGTAEVVALGTAISAGTVTVNTTGYTLALANNTLTATSMNNGAGATGALTLTGGAGTTSAMNVVTLNAAGSGWVTGTSVALTGSGNPAVGSTQNGALLKLVLGDVTALGDAELKVKHAMIQTGAAGMTVTNPITNAGASLYFGGEFDFTVSGLVKNDSGADRTIGVWSGATKRTITLGNLNNNGRTFNFEARGGATPNLGGGFIVNGKITGTGGISTVGTTQFSGNILTLNGASDYTGVTSMLSGRLQLNGSLTSAVTISTGATLSGTGSTTGLLTLNGGSILSLPGGAATTSLTSAGVTFAGTPTVVFATTPVTSTVYDVLTYGAGPVTNPANLKVPYRGILTDTGTKYTFTGGAYGQTRTWNTTTGTWDAGTTPNWLEGDNLFYAGDNAIFNNPASDSVVTLAGVLSPASVTVNNTNLYTFSGTGSITGATGLAKSGTGALAIGSQQSYTGGTTVNGGSLDLTGGGGINGVIRGTVTVTNGGLLNLSTADATGYGGGASSLNIINLVDSTLNVNTVSPANNQTLGSAVLNMTGSAITGIVGSNLDFFGGGSKLNTLASATSSTISLPSIRLRQNDTVFDIADGTAADDLVISASIGQLTEGNRALIKNGAGTMKLTGISVFLGNITINNGVLDLTTPGSKIYNAAFNDTNVVTVNAGATLKLNQFNYDASMGKLSDIAARRVINGGTIEVVGDTHVSGNDFTVSASGGTFRYNPTLAASTLTLAGNVNTNIPITGLLTFRADGNIIVNEVIEGTGGSLTKTGNGSVQLNGSNTYTGLTTVSAGVLGGTGSIAGALTVQATGTLAPGVTVGTFTVGGNTNLAGTYAVEINGTTSDLLAVTGDLALGGPLTVSATTPSGTEWLIATYTGALTGTFSSVPSGYTVTATAGQVKLVATGGGNDYANWISGFNVGGLTGPNDDFDNDGLDNSVENVLGSNPSVSNTGLTAVSATGSSFKFQHNQSNEIATDVTKSYQFSTDLIEWKASGGTTNGTTATITEAIITDTVAPANDVIEVTVTVTSGPAVKVFARLVATQG